MMFIFANPQQLVIEYRGGVRADSLRGCDV